MGRLVTDANEETKICVENVSFELIDYFEKKLRLKRTRDVNIGGNCFWILQTEIGKVKLALISKAFR